MSSEDFKNKIALITGAGGGIGSVLTKKLVEKGVYCIMVDRHSDLSPEQESYISQKQGEYHAVDLTKQENVDKFHKEIAGKFDQIDYLFNVAGIGIYKKLEDLSLEEWNTSLALDLTAPFYLAKKFLDLLKASDTPLVFNMGSGMGVLPSPGRIAYCSAKFGLRGLTLSLAKEFEDRKVKFQLLTLGSVMTNFGTGGLTLRKDLEKTGKKYLTPESVAEKMLELTLDRNSPSEVEFYPEGYEEENA